MADYFDAPCRGSPDQELLARFGLGKDGFGETPKPARGVRADWHSVRSAECIVSGLYLGIVPGVGTTRGGCEIR